MSDTSTLRRPTRPAQQASLFDMPPPWEEHWWGMPEFTMGDATPMRSITINFLTVEDVREFARRTGLAITAQSDSAWFPPQRLDEPKEWEYVED
jgi:hypothetical protein